MKKLVHLFQSLVGGSDPSLHLSPVDAHEKIKGSKSLQLVDVRSKEEYQGGRIPGSRLIPVSELGRRMKELDKTRPILLYCRSGNRSGMALHMLKDSGYPQVTHIRGGIMAWAHEGLPVEI